MPWTGSTGATAFSCVAVRAGWTERLRHGASKELAWAGSARLAERAMAIFYLNVSVIKRSEGRSVVAVAAYCSGSRLHDERLGRDVSFEGRCNLLHSEILLPVGAPERWLKREVFWNEVEAIEERGDAQLAREVELVLPWELSSDSGICLARDFIMEQFISRGIVVDFNVHRAIGADGVRKNFAHALFSMREIAENGFGKKRADFWKAASVLLKWRERWATLAIKRLADAGRRVQIDAGPGAVHGRGLDLAGGSAIEERESEEMELAWRNGERIIAEPGLVLAALMREHSSFTRQDLRQFVEAHTVSEKQFAIALARVESSVEIIRLSAGDEGEERFSTRQRMVNSGHGAVEGKATDVTTAAKLGGVDQDGPPTITMGDKASGELGSLREAAMAWAAAGLRVRGVGLTYEKAKAFEKTSGIKSVAVHGLLGRWMKKQDRLEAKDVLVVTEVRKLSEKQKGWMLSAARAVKAKLVIVLESGFRVIDGGDVGLDEQQFQALMQID